MASIEMRPDGRYRARWREGPQKIGRSGIQAWVKKLRERLAPGSVELVYRWVATIFKAAVGGRLIPASPCIRIALLKKLDTQ